SLVFDRNGDLCKRLPSFEEALDIVVVNDDGLIETGSDGVVARRYDQDQGLGATGRSITAGRSVSLRPIEKFNARKNIESIYKALITGISDYFKKMNFTKAIVGSSGGIDSAVVLALACEALGRENVNAILMPSPYSTQHSIDDAVQLSKNLNNPYEII